MLTFKTIEENEIGRYVSTPTLGGDPEGFIVDDKDNLIIPPAEQIECRGGEVGPDGAQVEMRVKASTCRGYFVDNARGCLSAASEIAEEFGGKLILEPALEISKIHKAKLPTRANFFGCDEDWCAYSGDRSTLPMDAHRHPWRYAGGHMHFGSYSKEDYSVASFAKKYAPYVIQLTDVLVGLFSVAINIETSLSKNRRMYVGKAGCFRLQPHGYEYRVPDCFFWKHPKLVYAMYSLGRTSYKIYTSFPEIAKAVVGATKVGLVPSIINSADSEAAGKLWTDIVEKFIPKGTFSGTLEDIVFGGRLLQASRRIAADLSERGPSKSWKLIPSGQQLSPYEEHGGFCNGGMESLCRME